MGVFDVVQFPGNRTDGRPWGIRSDEIAAFNANFRYIQPSIVAFTALVAAETWYFHMGNVRDGMVRKSLLLFHVVCISAMLVATMVIWQVLSPNPVLFHTNQVGYGFTLVASYVFFYAKQRLLNKNKFMIQFLPIEFQKRSKRVRALFKIVFVGYALFIPVLPFLPSVWLRPDMKSLYYKHALWEVLVIALGDTTISSITLFMFIDPLLQIRNALAEQYNDTNLNLDDKLLRQRLNSMKQKSLRNAQWATVAIGSTFIFLLVGQELLPDYQELWTSMGTTDLMINVVAVRFMIASTFTKQSGKSSSNATAAKSNPRVETDMQVSSNTHIYMTSPVETVPQSDMSSVGDDSTRNIFGVDDGSSSSLASGNNKTTKKIRSGIKKTNSKPITARLISNSLSARRETEDDLEL